MKTQRKRLPPRDDLRDLRIAAGQSKNQVAGRLGISRAQLRYIEIGLRGASAELEERMVALYATMNAERRM